MKSEERSKATLAVIMFCGGKDKPRLRSLSCAKLRAPEQRFAEELESGTLHIARYASKNYTTHEARASAFVNVIRMPCLGRRITIG